MVPDISHHPLSRADGSATFSSDLYTVLAAVNGPIEVQRRDELAEEAAIEVNIRPAAGVGSPRERWLESVLVAVLRSILLVHMHPRTLFQITLQITKTPTLAIKGAVKDVAILPALVNASFLGLVDAGLPLQNTVAAVLFAVLDSDKIKQDPSEKELVGCKSVHALAYTNQHSDLLLNESAGSFKLAQWEQVAEMAERACEAATAPMEEDVMKVDGADSSTPWLRQELEAEARAAVAWREAT